MADFLALYRGRTISEAEIVAVTAEPLIVEKFFVELLGEGHEEREAEDRAQHHTSTLEVVRDE